MPAELELSASESSDMYAEEWYGLSAFVEVEADNIGLGIVFEGLRRDGVGPLSRRNCCNLFSVRSLCLSSKGKPHPHFVHFLSICCSHILCQTASSSASSRHVRLTCAALHREVGSRKQRMRSPISCGSAARKSILRRSRTDQARKESCGKQHCASMPCSMSSRCFEGAAEKSDQTWLMPC